MEMDNGTYYMKPMNCPMHCLIFQSRQRSYRELPLRLFELGTVYRYERAGTLHGLMRIRGFTQDDSHIFCTEEQMPDEIASLLDFVMSVLRAFGFDEFTFNLSTKDPNKYVGADEIWEEATEALRAALERHGLAYEVKKGDAAFYGPKIDIDVRDAIGRTWQLSTIQFDFNHPERFELEYVGADNARHRPIMLHRALFGSIERFFGVLLEHYAGAFPTWLAPVQVRVLPVATAHEEYAADVADRIARRRCARRRRRRRRSARQADPDRQAREDPVRAGRRRRRRRRQHGRRQPARRRRSSAASGSTSSSGASPTRSRRPRMSPSEPEVPGARTALERLACRVRAGCPRASRRSAVRAACSRGSSHPGSTTPRPTSSTAARRASRSSTPFPTASDTCSSCRTARSPTSRISTATRRPSCGATVTDAVRRDQAGLRAGGDQRRDQPRQAGRRFDQ